MTQELVLDSQCSLPLCQAEAPLILSRQFKEKCHAAKGTLYFAFEDPEKRFDRVPRGVLRWQMRSLGVEE